MTHWRDFLDPTAPRGDYLPWKVVAKRTSLSRTTAWRLQRCDEFPRPYPISPGRVGHLECEVEAWIASRAARPGETSSTRRQASRRDKVPTRGTAPASAAPRVRASSEAPTGAPVIAHVGLPTAGSPSRTSRPPGRPGRADRSGDAARRQLTLDL